MLVTSESKIPLRWFPDVHLRLNSLIRHGSIQLSIRDFNACLLGKVESAFWNHSLGHLRDSPISGTLLVMYFTDYLFHSLNIL